MYNAQQRLRQAAAVKYIGDLADFVLTTFSDEVLFRYRNIESTPEIINQLGIINSYDQHAGRKLDPEIARRGVLRAIRKLIPDKEERERLRVLHQSKGGKNKRKTDLDWDACNVYGISLRDYVVDLSLQEEFQYFIGNRKCTAYSAIASKINPTDFDLDKRLTPGKIKLTIYRHRKESRTELYETLDKMVDAAEEGNPGEMLKLNKIFNSDLEFADQVGTKDYSNYDKCRQSLISSFDWSLGNHEPSLDEAIQRFNQFSPPKQRN